MEGTEAFVRQIRRVIHQTPEIGFAEYETSRTVAAVLRDIGIETRCGVAATGVVGLIRGGSPGPTVGLRCELDGLEVQECTGVDWQSTRKGFMHACGHDAHMAMVLGAARALWQDRAYLAGDVKLIFQPAEESPGGAVPMIEQGVLENPHVDRMIGLHVYPDLPLGQLGIRRGVATAALDRFSISIVGKGGHAASPHQGRDALLAACELVQGLHHIVSRSVDPLEPAVLGIGKLTAGTAYNTIAEAAHILGTVRTVGEDTRDRIQSLIEARTRAACESNRVEGSVDYVRGYPAVVNDSEMAEMAQKVGSRLLGAGNVVDLDRPSMVGEDFAYFCNATRGILLWLGVGGPDCGYPLHHPKFLVPDEALVVGTAILSEMVRQCLT